MKYCSLCQRYVDPVKKFNWVLFLLTLWFGVGIVYLLYYLTFGKKNRCPICKTTKLVDYSPEDYESKSLEKLEKKEQRKEFVDNVKNSISEKLSGDEKEKAL